MSGPGDANGTAVTLGELARLHGELRGDVDGYQAEVLKVSGRLGGIESTLGTIADQVMKIGQRLDGTLDVAVKKAGEVAESVAHEEWDDHSKITKIKELEEKLAEHKGNDRRVRDRGWDVVKILLALLGGYLFHRLTGI